MLYENPYCGIRSGKRQMSQTFSVFRKMASSVPVAVHGQVATKPHVVDLMLDLAGYFGDPSKCLLDPGCGEGAFTVAAAIRLIRAAKTRSFDKLSNCIRGVEK